MTNEQNVVRSVFNSYINDIKVYSTRPNTPMIKMLEDVEEILDVLRNMDDAIDVICNLDVDAVLEHLEADEEG